MFPANQQSQRFPFQGNQPMRFDPMGFNPFDYHNQTFQEDDPFRRDFFMPQQPPQHQGQPFQDQGFQGHGLGAPRQRRMPSLLTDANGNIDFNKIGNGVQSALGIASQVAPMMKMFGGFFR
ncbi:hypothetical protein [Desertibacillus haloalkaliphilus]|uniref:hypothetical protein n=1 Tax=Desertibacillus haloalkaliphilus TaxID=1328930 RepID=UPI001C26AAC3|nr:hypothetical protein [Desertibacillus haloalkaliphilus]MBU8906366.1 hypothetical protein [Desertibacillus haloalkaliphilus]